MWYHQMFRFLFIGIFTLSMACSKQDNMVEVPIIEIPEEEEPEVIDGDGLNYLALGDSYTIGQGVQALKRWPNQLSDQLEENDIAMGKRRIIAQTGWTTGNLINAIENTDLSDFNGDCLVSLLIGVNNQYQSLAFEIFQSEFDILLEKSIQIAGDKTKVFVVSIPDYGVTPFGSNDSEQIGKEIDLHNEYMADQCADLEIPFIDITQISRDLGDGDNALASDNLHPSGFQYEKWTEKILPVVIDLLSN